jgi:tetratricopeptide (TPR) repeat protein
MRNLFLLIIILVNSSCFCQVSSTTALRCGSNDKKANEYFQAANFALMTNKLNEARALFIAATRIDSTFCDAWDNLSVVCRRLGQLKDAFIAGLYSLGIDSTNTIAWSNCGYAAFLSNDSKTAITSFDNMQRIIPNDPEGYYGKSLVLYSIDSISDARINIYKAIEKYNLGNTKIGKEVDLLRGFIEYKYGNKIEAQSIFRRVYPKFKDNPELNYFLGICLLENDNNKEKSDIYIKKAIQLGYEIENQSPDK